MLAVVAATLAGAPGARAQDTANEATALFERGRELYKAKDYEGACAALVASERLDPAVGTLGLLAACLEAQGRVATAYRKYLATADRASALGDSREEYARARAAALKASLPVLIVHSGANGPTVEALCDNERLQVGAPVFVDPGSHRIVARAPAKAGWQADIIIARGETKTLVLPTLGAGVPPSRASDATGSANAESRDAAASPKRADTPAGETQRTIGWIGIGVGALGVVVGSVAGAAVLADKSSLDDDPACPKHCSDVDRVNRYNTLRGVATASLIAGGVGLAGGALLLLFAPRTTRAGAHLEPHSLRRITRIAF